MEQYSPSQYTVLLVDNDINVLRVLEARFTLYGYNVISAYSGEGALDLLQKKPIDIVISDIKMPGMGGKKLLREIYNSCPWTPVIFLTAYGSIPEAVEAVREGAVDYLTKPFDGRALVEKVKQHLKPYIPKGSLSSEFSISDKIWGGYSSSMQNLFKMIEKIAPTEVNVLITGESGTGKELVARVLHEKSPRVKGPFSVVDCGSTTNSLLESELFGHIKGSFTHALQNKKGLIQEAHRGTLFLDEIGNISLDMQTRLLRFLQERTVRRVGDTKETPVDCRIIAATNADLTTLVQEGAFREDLYFRLKGVIIYLPSLRERREDIPVLAERFLAEFCKQTHRVPMSIDPETMKCLLNYSWPGNIRELKQVLEAGTILSKNNVLRPDDLQLEGMSVKYDNQKDMPLSLQESERLTIIRALEEANWVQKKAADILGISRRAIHYKIKRLGIDFHRKNKR